MTEPQQGTDQTNKAKLGKAIRLAAMDSLSRREHSRFELRQKLSSKFPDQLTLIEQELTKLCDASLQSDERFVEMFLRSRLQRQQGPVKIRHELQRYGIADDLLASNVDDLDEVWLEQAVAALQKKYVSTLDITPKAKAQALRFLAQRGFTFDQSYQAWQSWLKL